MYCMYFDPNFNIEDTSHAVFKNQIDLGHSKPYNKDVISESADSLSGYVTESA